MKKTMRKIKMLFIVVGIIVMFSLASCGGSGSSGSSSAADSKAAAPLRFKTGITVSLNTIYGQGLVRIAEEIKKSTNGKVEVEVFGNAQLGNERDMLEGAQLGTIDMPTAANAVITNFVPQMAILDLPFLFLNIEKAHKVIDGKLGDMIAKELATKSIHVLGWMDAGYRQFYSVKPVNKAADFKGLKVRTMENQIHISFFNALGAIGTPMPSGEQYTAFQQGTIDAAENGLTFILEGKYFEVTKNVTWTNHVFGFIAFMASDKAWKQIPDDLKPAVKDGALKGCAYERDLLQKSTETTVADLKKQGVTFHEIDFNSLRDTVAPAMSTFLNRIPKEWVDVFNDAVK